MKAYSKPSISVKCYCVEDVCSTSGSTSTCDYYKCLVGGQTEYVSDVTIYTYEDSNGNKYYVWYKEYDDENESVDTNYMSLLREAVQSINSNSNIRDYSGWHISTFYTSSFYTS